MKADLDKLRKLAKRGDMIPANCMMVDELICEIERLRKIEALAYAMANGGIPSEQLNAMFELRQMMKEATP